MANSMIYTAIIDDHQLFIDGLKSMLESEGTIKVVGTGNTGQALLDNYMVWQPDVILMDINMPEVDGLAALGQLIEHFPDARVIMMTMLKDHEFINRAMQDGAYGYVMKNASSSELFSVIEKAHKGEKHFGDTALKAFLSQYDNKKKPESAKPEDVLTKREIEIVKLVAEEHTSAEIAEKLFVSLSTVETHRRNVMLKLDLKNTVGLTRYAISHGLVEV